MTMRTLHRFVAAYALLMALMASTATAQNGMLLAPTGLNGVGRLNLHWKDDSRSEVLSTRTTDKRELGVWIWYPANSDAAKPTAPYVDQLDALARSLSRDQADLARSIQTHAVRNAPLVISPTRFPILIFSPGSGSIPALYTTFFEDLASHGYIVAALDHPYDDVAVQLSDGRVVKEAEKPLNGDALLQYQRTRVRVRSDDVRFAVDQLSLIQQGKLDTPFTGRLDLTRIGVFGHSTGGMTAAEACMKDSRLKACANFDGVVNAQPAYPDPQGRGPIQPFLFLEKPLPNLEGEKPEDAKQRLSLLRQRGNALLAGVQRGRSYRITVEGATHSTFSDEEAISDPKATRPRELLDLVRRYVREFFDEAFTERESSFLKNTPSDRAVQIETFLPR